jgi:cobalamin biosynthesis protein CobD/CbiB
MFLEARAAIAKLVGRDTSRMDIAACRRAAIESISENLTDGWVSALFWYALGGLPALLFSRWSARWTQWSAIRHRGICNSDGAAREWTI